MGRTHTQVCALTEWNLHRVTFPPPELLARAQVACQMETQSPGLRAAGPSEPVWDTAGFHTDLDPAGVLSAQAHAHAHTRRKPNAVCSRTERGAAQGVPDSAAATFRACAAHTLSPAKNGGQDPALGPED